MNQVNAKVQNVYNGNLCDSTYTCFLKREIQNSEKENQIREFLQFY